MESKPRICEIFQDQIDEMSQPELNESPPALLAQHLEGCPRCHAYWEQALALAGQLDQWEVPEPTRNMGVAVMADIAQYERDQRVDRRPWTQQLQAVLQRRLQIPVSLAAAVLLMLVLSIALNVTHRQVVPAVYPVARMLPAVEERPVLPAHIQGGVMPVTWNGSSTAPSTYVIILGAPPVMPTDTLFIPPTPIPSRAL